MDLFAVLQEGAAVAASDAPQQQDRHRQQANEHVSQTQTQQLLIPHQSTSPSMRLASILNAEQLPRALPPHQSPYQHQDQFQYQPPQHQLQYQQQQQPSPFAEAESSAPQEVASQAQVGTGYWREEEKAAAIEAFRTIGDQPPKWSQLAERFVPTRSGSKLKSFYERWRRKQDKQVVGSSSTREVADLVAPPAPAASRVLDLSAVELVSTSSQQNQMEQQQQQQQQRTRCAARSSQSRADVTLVAPVGLLPEVIEINTEESAGETPQKGPPPPRSESTRTRVRAQRPPLSNSSTKSNSSGSTNSSLMVPPQRKKAKLTVTIPRRVLEAPLDSPSSTAASWTSSAKPPRGKKRPPVEFEGIPMPSPATTAHYSPFDERDCEFCRSPYGVCAIMHCSACKRVYHPKCVVNYYKPYCASADEPIEKQLEALQLNTPPQVKVNMFRCTSCFAACVESFRSGGFEWDCTCPSCSQPQKLVEYRSRMLLHLMYGGGDLKPVRKQKGSATNQEGEHKDAAAAKPKESKKTSTTGAAVVVPVRVGARRKGRNSASVSEIKPMEVDSEAPSIESNVPANEENCSSKQCATESMPAENEAPQRSRESENGDDKQKLGTSSSEPKSPVHMNGKQSDVTGMAEPEREKEAPADNNDDEETLSDEEILAAVTVNIDEKGFRIFPIVCTETASLTVSGLMKAGQYYAHRSSMKYDFVRCDCCSKTMPREQFVRHTDATFLEMKDKTPSDFLFAAHRDGMNHLPLEKFLHVLKQHKVSSKAVEHHHYRKPIPATSKKNASSRNGSHSSNSNSMKVASSDEPSVSREDAMTNTLQLLETSMIVRRASNSSRSAKPGFLVKLVCMSNRLMIRMANGVVQSKLDPSTPGQAFPYKEGWLSFEKGSAGSGKALSSSSTLTSSPTFTKVLCSCCSTDKTIEDFIAHTELSTGELGPRDGNKFKRHHVFVPQRDNNRMLVEFEKVWQAVIVLHNNQLLDSFLSGISEATTNKASGASPS